VGFNEGIVDGDDVDVVVLNGISEDETTNAAETVDTDLCLAHGSVEMLDSDLVLRWPAGRSQSFIELSARLDDAESSRRR